MEAQVSGLVRGSVELQKAQERIAGLEDDIRRLETVNGRLMEEFARWAYNAHIRGMDEQQLRSQLPKVDRDSTRQA